MLNVLLYVNNYYMYTTHFSASKLKRHWGGSCDLLIWIAILAKAEPPAGPPMVKQ
jgi:hypothetical protein